ncbi:mitochondrial potassium channel ATP-binding subunit isoform X3 [Heterodontus francisci]|uniref:mitochondrial potassium channel ATP-binding subunit isoform X3 n=1 Tax=Heterodontus francisci TaxID=7792 RepID=UPI00355C7201
MLHLCLRSGAKARGFFLIRSVHTLPEPGGRIITDSGRCCLSWGQQCWRFPPGMKISEYSFFFQLLNQSRNSIRQRACGWRKHPVRTQSAFLLVATPGLITLGLRLHNTRAHCEEDHSCKVQNSKQPVPEFNWKVFWKFLRPELTALIWAVIFACGAALLNTQIPLLLGNLMNAIVQCLQTNPACYFRAMKVPGVKLLVSYTLQALLTCCYITLLSRVGERVAASIRKELFATLLRQDVAFFDATRTGQMVSRLTNDIQEFKSSFKLVVSQGLKSAAQTIGCLVSLYFVSPKLTNLMCVAMPVLVGTGAYLGSYLRRLSQKAQEQIAKATCVADDALGNIRTVKAFAMEELEIEFFSKEVDKSSNMSQFLGFGIGIFQGLSNFTLNCIVLGTICVSGVLLAKEQLRAGDMMSFLVATQTVQSYPTRPGHVVLHNFNLTLPASKMVAIVGQSGTGKSTVASLLERFYDPVNGVITLDGYDIRTLDPNWLRSHVIGYISQEPVLFGTTIKENIRYAKPDASDEEVYEAARQANADGFIQTFPDGYMTIVGERGISLSGGQKQRIAIARALIKNPRILVLDEATSALDAESERVVQEALDRIQRGRTVLVIAHRLSTIKAADIICVLANGRVKEVGTHAELLKRGGLYAELFRRQTTEETIM